TVPILIFALVYLSHFDFQRPATWVWFFLFLTIAPYSVYNIWHHRYLSPGSPIRMLSLLRSYLLVQGIVLALYALAMMVVPTFSTAFWPWKIDEFHGRIYSAIFLTGGVGSLVLWKSASGVEMLMLGLTETVLGFFVILGLVITDASQHRVNWSLSNTWLWLIIFTLLFITGVGLTSLSLARGVSRSTTQGVSV
ncbi:MAG: hypothetical protein M3Z24_04595, partial [Chloroflexota bacterium]|nr:hypothetical protein [Chloroflexota bacterium]